MSFLIVLFLTFQLFIVAFFDLKTKKISNKWLLLNLVGFFILTFISSQYSLSGSTFSIPLIFLLVGFALFKLNVMGAGDSKYLFSFFLLIPIGFQEGFLFNLVFATCLVGGIMIVIKVIQNYSKIRLAFITRDVRQVKGVFGGKFSFAPVILLAWLSFLWINRKEISIINL